MTPILSRIWAKNSTIYSAGHLGYQLLSVMQTRLSKKLQDCSNNALSVIKMNYLIKKTNEHQTHRREIIK